MLDGQICLVNIFLALRKYFHSCVSVLRPLQVWPNAQQHSHQCAQFKSIVGESSNQIDVYTTYLNNGRKMGFSGKCG